MLALTKKQYILSLLLFKKSIYKRSEISIIQKIIAEMIESLFHNAGFSFSQLNTLMSLVVENKTVINFRFRS
jgi:hypothetical protein